MGIRLLGYSTSNSEKEFVSSRAQLVPEDVQALQFEEE